MVKISIGLRTPELYSDTSKGIMDVPQTFKRVLIHYLIEMGNKIEGTDYENMAMIFLSMTFGFVFFKASFEDHLTALEKEEYIQNSVRIFVKGIQKK